MVASTYRIIFIRIFRLSFNHRMPRVVMVKRIFLFLASYLDLYSSFWLCHSFNFSSNSVSYSDLMCFLLIASFLRLLFCHVISLVNSALHDDLRPDLIFIALRAQVINNFSSILRVFLSFHY